MRVEYISVPLAILAFCIALYQYWKAQKWKRSEFVAAEIKDAFSNPSVRNALYLLDWNERNYDLRERDDQKGLVDVPIGDVDLMKALAPHLDRPEGFTQVEERIRVVFDEFLGRIQRFEHFIEAG